MSSFIVASAFVFSIFFVENSIQTDLRTNGLSFFYSLTAFFFRIPVVVVVVFDAFLDALSHLYKTSCLSVSPSVIFKVTLGPSCVVYPTLLDATTYLYERCFSVGWSIRRSIRRFRVIFEIT